MLTSLSGELGEIRRLVAGLTEPDRVPALARTLDALSDRIAEFQRTMGDTGVERSASGRHPSARSCRTLLCSLGRVVLCLLNFVGLEARVLGDLVL